MWSRRDFVTTIAFGAAGISAMPSFAMKKNNLQQLQILHTNDMHCHFEPFPDTDPRNAGKGGMNRIAAYVKKLRESDSDLLLFDSGDFSQGTPYFNFFKAELVLRLMSEMKYDAGTVGNHEFDNGVDDLNKALRVANFPLITSNYDFSKNSLSGTIIKNKIFERQGIRIGVYGLGVELNGLVGDVQAGQTQYLDPVETALSQEDYLKNKEHCDLVICLSHLGHDYKDDKISDFKLAPQTSFTDLILGGHTHSFFEKPVEFINKRNNKVIVNQAGFGALMLGQIDVYFEKKRKSFVDFSKNSHIE
jgi:5'-nucleotidase